jgi:nicotinate phosphoribosyltransferase
VDAVYKLAEYEGRPVLKLSPAKATAPGRKQVWRGPSEDVIGLRDEAAPGPHHEPLLEPVMRAGRRLTPAPSIAEMRGRFERDLAALPVKAARLTHPEHVIAHRTEALAALTTETAEAVRRRVRSSD